MDEEVFTRLYDQLDVAWPEFGFDPRGDRWVATDCPAGFPSPGGEVRPDRIMCYADAPHAFHVQGLWSMSWARYLNKGKPLGGVYEEVCRGLAKKVGVPFPELDLTDADREDARRWEERRDLLRQMIRLCRDYLFSPHGVAARAYMKGRGFSDDDLKALGIGLYPPPGLIRLMFAKAGLDADAAKEHFVLDGRMSGYITFPWYDSSGSPMTMYGRWPDKDIPFQKNHPGWAWKRNEALKEWDALPADEKAHKPWVEPEIPKTNTLRGTNTKSSPLFFDRALKAGEQEHLTAVEGVGDGSMLQVRGLANAVAYVAASFSAEQINTLVRHGVKYVTIVPDPDGGGVKGCLGSLKALRKAGIVAFVATLPDGLDPDEFVIRDGIAAFRDLVEKAQPGGEYEALQLIGTVTKDSPEPERLKARDRALEFVKGLDGTERDAVVRVVARKLGYTVAGVAKDVGSRKKKDPPPKGTGSPPADGKYTVENGCLAMVRTDRDGGSTTIPLCNFTARIVEEIVRDDGVERSRLFVVEGQLANGEKLPPAQVGAEEFGGMNWTLRHWGTRAIVHAGMGTKDHLRAAIQSRSSDAPRRTVYAHTGWAKAGGSWVYLHAGGAIGPVGPVDYVSVELPEVMQNYRLPVPPAGEDLAKAVRGSLDLLRNLAPDAVAFALKMVVAHAALPGGDFSGHLSGSTGSYKTELATLAAQHWGPGITARKLPANWSSSGNSLELLAFHAKDALLVVDDFIPAGSGTDISRYHRDADRLLRAQGNQSGRQRLGRDSSLRPAKPPRGMILSTGEEIPRGHSLRARMLTVDVVKADIKTDRLTECQKQAADGVYASANAGWIRWLASRYDGLAKELTDARERIRAELLKEAGGGWHPRTVTMAADLIAGWQLHLRFAVECGAIDQVESQKLMERARAALLALAAEQAAYQADANPCDRYLALLRSALASGRAHVATVDGKEPKKDPGVWGWRDDPTLEEGRRPMGTRIGWVDGPDVYLDPHAAFAEANKLASSEESPLTIGPSTLAKRLKDGGLLASTGESGTPKRIMIQRTIEKKRHWVLHFLAKTLLEGKDGPTGPTSPTSGGIDTTHGGSKTTTVLHHFSDPSQKVMQESDVGQLSEEEEDQDTIHGRVEDGTDPEGINASLSCITFPPSPGSDAGETPAFPRENEGCASLSSLSSLLSGTPAPRGELAPTTVSGPPSAGSGAHVPAPWGIVLDESDESDESDVRRLSEALRVAEEACWLALLEYDPDNIAYKQAMEHLYMVNHEIFLRENPRLMPYAQYLAAQYPLADDPVAEKPVEW
jgi:hypothetical protein